MDHTRATEEEVREALDGYRWALNDALRDAGGNSTREAVIARARELLAEDNEDQHDIIVDLARGDFGDPVWSLEEEIVDDEETVPSGDTDDADDDENLEGDDF